MGRVKMDFASMSELYRQALIADHKRYSAMPKTHELGAGVTEPLLDPDPEDIEKPAAAEPKVEGLEQAAAGSLRLAKNGFFYEAQADGSWKKIDWFP